MFLQNRYRCVLVAVAGLLVATASHAKTNYVDGAAKASIATGESWKTAFPSLQQAIDDVAALGGGEVWVKAGTYKPDGDNRHTTFALKPGVAVYGGFRGSETALDQRNPKGIRTILSGDIGRAGSSSDNCHHVVTGASNTRLDGFTVSRGNANSGENNQYGGGLLLPAGTVNATVANCIFEKNAAISGGAIHCESSALTATNCTFFSNSGKTGGAVSLSKGSWFDSTDCVFTSNFAPKGGGAIVLPTDSEARISGASFAYNSTDASGGAILASTGKKAGIALELHKTKFSDNSAKLNGGAIALKGEFVPIIANCSFSKNLCSKGAGAIGIEAGTSVVVTDTSFFKNAGAAGQDDIGKDDASRVLRSADRADKYAAAKISASIPRSSSASPAAAPAESKPKRQLADVYVHDAQNIKVKLRSIVADAGHTAIALGDLTDPDFIGHYRNVEAAARDYTAKGVNFFYLYRFLRHPESNGYIEPFMQQERARHAKVAEELLFTAVPWLYDLMDNQAAEALAPANKSNLFIFSNAGEEVYAGAISDEAGLRKALAEIAGEVEIPTTASALPNTELGAGSPDSKLVERAKVLIASGFLPLETTPLDPNSPHYVKLRFEGDKELLASGNGKIYLGFHIDPLYGVAWNNLGEPMKYALKTPVGVVAPSMNSAPRVSDQATDAEPREFLLEARKLDPSKPLILQVNYSVHSLSARKNIEATQQYHIYLQPDPFGGQVIGRQVSASKPVTGATKTAQPKGSAFDAMLRRFDLDRNGKLSTDEALGTLLEKFGTIDANGDGFIMENEFLHYLETRQ
ncbi:hypothetical protein PDESU_00663 [Pontiella desulfatans]|uniref:EF-hand domain-containing protein n=1 Tax=Pontiella desulfatans TaxID=2750659 RepID=A0A6C2TWY0_PONDE|nr:EF-hand domain-containing protein [Pontiella desulfatans]VGO12113.1 hypothetical protein PDESU_00663 [Pontiella desulfatans]